MTAKLCDFYETARKIRMAVACNPALKPRDKLVVTVMLDGADPMTFASTGLLMNCDRVETVAARSTLTTRDVERARSALLKAGVVERHHPGGRGQASQMRFYLPAGEGAP